MLITLKEGGSKEEEEALEAACTSEGTGMEKGAEDELGRDMEGFKADNLAEFIAGALTGFKTENLEGFIEDLTGSWIEALT